MRGRLVAILEPILGDQYHSLGLVLLGYSNTMFAQCDHFLHF